MFCSSPSSLAISQAFSVARIQLLDDMTFQLAFVVDVWHVRSFTANQAPV
jgi:hypothetical protein